MNAEEIFTIRFLPLYDKMYRAAAAILGADSGEAADAVQDAMVRIWRSGVAMGQITNPEGYAMMAVRSAAIDILRKRRRWDPLEGAVSALPGHPPDPDAVEMLERIVDSLPQGQLEVVRLSAFANLSNDEIASVTGYSAVNVRTLLSRGRKKIKELYKKYLQS